jgi:hypothetical protein
MPTRKQAALRLKTEHDIDGVSWPKLSKRYANIPGATLRKIAITGGRYWPHKHARLLAFFFGVTSSNKTSSRKHFTLAEMSTRALIQSFYVTDKFDEIDTPQMRVYIELATKREAV